MPSVNTNEKENKSLGDFLGEHNAKAYTDMIINAPKEADKGASFQVGDGFRTPTYVAGAKDRYLNPLNIEKGPMDYIAAFAKDSLEKLQAVSKVLDPNNEKKLVQPNYHKETGELTSYNNTLSGSVTLTAADGENYRLNIQQRGMGTENVPYRPSKTEVEIYGKEGNPNRPTKIQVVGAEISVSKQDKETKEYSQEMGKIMLWGQADQRGKLVPIETEREGAVVNNYFSVAKNQDTKTLRFVAQLVKDGFAYTPEQREAEKANPELKTETKNMSFRIMDKNVAQDIKNTFVKTAEDVTKDTSRNIPNIDNEGKEVGKSMFVSVTLDTASTINAEGKNVAKTTAILTPAIWTDAKHKIDYTQHIAKVDTQYGQKKLSDLGANLNKAVEAYVSTKNVNKEVSEKNIEKITKGKNKTKEKDIDY